MSSRKFSKEIEDQIDTDLPSKKRGGGDRNKQNREKPGKTDSTKREKPKPDDRIMVTVTIPRKAMAQLWKASGVSPDTSVKAEARLFASK
jgi:hypothetical protein